MQVPTKINRGFTVFFAILVASLALAIGLAIYDLTVRELNISITATQSQYAVYAADTGAECALYWDAKYRGAGSAFGTSTASVWPGSGSGLFCNLQDISTLWGTTPPAGTTASAATTTFTIQVSGQSQSFTTTCATVEVGKYTSPSRISYTNIVSHGYNTCAQGARGQLERIFQINY